MYYINAFKIFSGVRCVSCLDHVQSCSLYINHSSVIAPFPLVFMSSFLRTAPIARQGKMLTKAIETEIQPMIADIECLSLNLKSSNEKFKSGIV